MLDRKFLLKFPLFVTLMIFIRVTESVDFNVLPCAKQLPL